MELHALEHMLPHMGREGAHQDSSTVRVALAVGNGGSARSGSGSLGLVDKRKVRR